MAEKQEFKQILMRQNAYKTVYFDNNRRVFSVEDKV